MKRYAYYLLIMAAAAMVACQAEPVNNSDPETPEVPELQNGTYIYTINASIPEEESKPEQIAVKSNYDSEGQFSWSAGDAISVLFHDASKEDSDPEKNKFFTLTLTSGAGNKAASFSGAITSGYTIGASDGTVGDQKIWALFPASANHTFQRNKANTADSVRFYVQPSVDFSATHFSANIPMYALNAAEGDLSFANLACTYKFIVTGIKDGVSKVDFTIYNQTTYALSGTWPIHPSGYYLNYDWASPGSANSTLTYVSDVTSNQAVFYVSSRYWGYFQPSITVKNHATGVAIKSFVAAASKQPTDMTSVQPITLDVSEAAGGNYFVPAISIDGDMSDWDPSTNAALTSGTNYRAVAPNSTYWKEFKVAYDERYVYFYVKRDYQEALWTGGGYFWFKFDTDGDANYENNIKFYIQPFNIDGSVYNFLSSPSAKDPSGTASGSFTLSCAGSHNGADIVELEVAAARSDLGLNKDDVFSIQSNSNKSAGTITISETLTINN